MVTLLGNIGKKSTYSVVVSHRVNQGAVWIFLFLKWGFVRTDLRLQNKPVFAGKDFYYTDRDSGRKRPYLYFQVGPYHFQYLTRVKKEGTVGAIILQAFLIGVLLGKFVGR